MPAGRTVQRTVIDEFNIAIGRATAWLTLAMVVVSFVIVVIRYVFDSGFIWLQESLTWMHATVFMLGAAYTMQRDEHVRVDIFYRNMSRRRKAIVDLAGVTVFVLPLCCFFAYEAFDYVAASWSIREVSLNAGGLPYPLLPLLKSMLLLMPLLVALQGVSLALLSLRDLKRS
ncbi:MAG: TRAP transporter small permease subunit [Gammaproteobacteria bacterium]|nr:TRAP transporter small permease subunit [Gammaproteobacteria bacterium]